MEVQSGEKSPIILIVLRHEKIRLIFYSWCSALYKAVGHDIFGEDGFKPYLYTYFVWCILALFKISSIYTLIYYDWFTRLNVIGNAAVGLQVSDFIQNCFLSYNYFYLIYYCYCIANDENPFH